MSSKRRQDKPNDKLTTDQQTSVPTMPEPGSAHRGLTPKVVGQRSRRRQSGQSQVDGLTRSCFLNFYELSVRTLGQLPTPKTINQISNTALLGLAAHGFSVHEQTDREARSVPDFKDRTIWYNDPERPDP